MHVIRITVAAIVAALVAVPLTAGASPAPPPTATGTTGSADGTAARLAEYADAMPANAISAAVLQDGEVTFAAAGTDVTGAPADEHTPFRIASMSKSFTAALVMQLVEEGRVDLDAPLTAVLPDFAMADDRAARITPRMLLTHTSGLGGAAYDEFGIPAPVGVAGVLENLRTRSLVAEPGTAFEYFNTNYALAAGVVERLEGRPFTEVLATRLLSPLGMADTTATDTCEGAVPGLGTGHAVAFGAPFPLPEAPGICIGSGGVVSTAADLATWLRFQSGDGTAADGTRVLTSASLDELHAPQPNAVGGGGDRYGFGWRSFEREGTSFIGHSGALSSWNSDMLLLSDADGRPTATGAVVLVDGKGSPALLSERLALAADGRTPPPLEPGADRAIDAGLAILAAVIAVLGIIGLARARTWPARRRSRAGRVLGIAWPLAGVAVGLALAPVLGRLLMDSTMGFLQIWWFATAWLPLVTVLAVALVGLGSAVPIARAVALGRSRRVGNPPCDAVASPGPLLVARP